MTARLGVLHHGFDHVAGLLHIEQLLGIDGYAVVCFGVQREGFGVAPDQLLRGIDRSGFRVIADIDRAGGIDLKAHVGSCSCQPWGGSVEVFQLRRIVDRAVVAQLADLVRAEPDGRAHGGEELIHLRVRLAGGGVVEIRAAAQDDGAAACDVVCNHGYEGVVKVARVVAGHRALCRRREDQQLAVIQHCLRDSVCHHSDAGEAFHAQLHNLRDVSGIAASHVVVIVCAVDDDVGDHRLGQEFHLQNAVVLLVCAVVNAVDRGVQDHRADAAVGEREAVGRGCVRGKHGQAVCREVDRVDGLPVQGEQDRADRQIVILVVVEVQRDIHFLVPDRNIGVGRDVLDADCLHLTDPDRSGHGDIAVGLRQAQIVVGIACAQIELHGGFPHRDGFGGSDDAAVDQNVHLDRAGVGRVGKNRLQMDGILHVLAREDRSHFIVVQRVVDAEIVVLRRVDAAVSHCVVDIVSRQTVGHNDAARRVGVAPMALVVVLIVGRRDVPAEVERSGVFLVGREIAGGADRSLAVAHLDDGNELVDDLVVIGVVLERAEGRAGVVELT